MEIYNEETEAVKLKHEYKSKKRKKYKINKIKIYIICIPIMIVTIITTIKIAKVIKYILKNKFEEDGSYSEIVKMPNGYEKFTVDKNLNIYYSIPKVKKEIKIKFKHWFIGFNYKHNVFTQQLSKRYKVIISNDDPDYIIYSVYRGSSEGQYNNKIKISYSEEIYFPNFNHYDYAISYNDIIYLDRHLRKNKVQFDQRYKFNEARKYVPGKKFCAIVVSNCIPTFRYKFFKELSKYKKVDSGGKCWNNIEQRVQYSQKINFFNNYKFSIVFENNQHVGYSTEKIYDAFLGNTIPIYFGDFSITEFINPKAFIHIRHKNLNEIKEKIELIKKIDQDESLYKQILNEPIFLQKNFVQKEIIKYYSFLFHIFDQDFESAKRRSNGF